MDRTAENTPYNTNNSKLRIWQQNINRSLLGQQDLLNMLGKDEYDICAIQEPYLDFMNKTRANAHWTVIYPSTHAVEPKKTRSVTLINKKLSTDKWEELEINSGDVTGLRLRTETNVIDLYNIYNDGENDGAIEEAGRVAEHHAGQRTRNGMIWLGDFNRHHPLWDEERNSHLFTERNLRMAQNLLDLAQGHGLQMALPKDIPTLRAFSTGNYTRLDNVFCTADLVNNIIICNTEPTRKPINTDHLPIITILDLEVLRLFMEPRLNYRGTDWEDFREKLRPKLETRRAPKTINSINEFNKILEHVSSALQKTIEEVVPRTKPCLFSKRWWNKNLSSMRRDFSRTEREAYKWKRHFWHPAHREAREKGKEYAAAIMKAKTKHWDQWLEELNEQTVWDVGRMANGPATDGGRARVPNLKGTIRGEERETIARDNETKARLLFEEFFPKPPENNNGKETLGAARWKYEKISIQTNGLGQ
jgi:hypothetical protein